MSHKTKKWALLSVVLALVLTIVSFSPTSATALQLCKARRDANYPISGYCNPWGQWVPGYISNETYMTPTPNHASGKMVFYGPRVMEATAEYRGLSLEGYVDGVALMSPIDIGKTVWIRVDGEWWGPFLSVDCARRGDMYTVVVYRQEVVEVGFNFAEQIGMVKRSPADNGTYKVFDWYRDVEVYVARDRFETELPDLSHSDPIHYPTWFVDNLSFTTRRESSVIDMGNGVWKLWGKDVYWYDLEYWLPDSLRDSVGNVAHDRPMMI